MKSIFNRKKLKKLTTSQQNEIVVFLSKVHMIFLANMRNPSCAKD